VLFLQTVVLIQTRHYSVLLTGIGTLEWHKRPIQRNIYETPTTKDFPNGLYKRIDSFMEELPQLQFQRTMSWTTGVTYTVPQPLSEVLNVDRHIRDAMSMI
jgi:hypothetical protein